jgi:hypothetical protein
VLKVLIPILCLVACEADHEKVTQILKAEGCTDIQVGGWTAFGCGKDDNMSNEFHCTKNGVPVHGIVCGEYGLLSKGYTVRYK